jgi:hypothetical protein
MNISLNPNDTAERSREAYKTNGRLEALTLDSPLREAATELAEKSAAQTWEAYARSKSALEAALDAMARSFDSLGQGAAALNCKIIDITRRNTNAGFDLAKSLATAKSLAEVMELRAIYWHQQLTALAAQAEEVRALSAKVAADMTAPITSHISRSMEKLRAEFSPRD